VLGISRGGAERQRQAVLCMLHLFEQHKQSCAGNAHSTLHALPVALGLGLMGVLLCAGVVCCAALKHCQQAYTKACLAAGRLCCF
jgi:hypothetical protein